MSRRRATIYETCVGSVGGNGRKKRDGSMLKCRNLGSCVTPCITKYGWRSSRRSLEGDNVVGNWITIFESITEIVMNKIKWMRRDRGSDRN